MEYFASETNVSEGPDVPIIRVEPFLPQKNGLSDSSETLIICTRTHEVTSQKTVCLLILVFLHLTAFNPLKTKRRLLYLKTQFVPRSKHFSSRL